jgi:hypothetical protein
MNDLKLSPQLGSLKSFLESTLANVHFGSIEIVVHESKIVQIEKREKFRPDDSGFMATPPRTS